MKKIIQVTTFYAPVVGGMETQVEDLCAKLIDSGYAVEVLTTNSSRGRRSIQAGADTYNGINVTRVPVWFSFTKFHKFAPGFWTEFARKYFDIIHVHGIRKPELYIALFWAKWRKKKIVVSTHNPFTVVERSWKYKLLIAAHDLFFGKLLMRYVDHYFLLSETEIPIMEELGVSKKQMTVIGNALHPQFFEDVSVDREKFLNKLGVQRPYKNIVLGVGRIHYMKGFQNLRYAIEHLPDTLFVIVGGDDGYMEELRRALQGLENLILTGTFFPREQLLEYYANADIFVMPSMHEPFGIVLLEAMAQGCAVVATNIGGPMGIVNPGGDDRVALNASNYGLVLNPLNQQGWLEKLQLLIDDPELLSVYQNKARKRAKDFTWKTILPKYLRIYGKA